MRIRTVKPEFHQDEEMSEVSAEAALLAIGLLNYADDEGWFKYHPKLIESSVFPLRELSVSIHGLLTELSNMGYFSMHEGSDGKKYGYISNFLKHQRVNRPSESKIATIVVKSIVSEDSMNDHGDISEDSLPERNREQGTGKGREGNSCPKTDVLEKLWKSSPSKCRERSSKKQVAAEWKKIKVADRPEENDLIEALEAWKHSAKWMDGFAEGLHLWIKNRQWENLPESAKPIKPETPQNSQGRALDYF